MATQINSNCSEAMQPGLRSFIVFDQLPTELRQFQVLNDWNSPHLRSGDIALVDHSDNTPSHGELFLIQWQSAPNPEIVEVFWMPKPGCWGTRVTCSEIGGVSRLGDWGYNDRAMRERIVGRVVGIFQAERAAIN